MLGKLECIAIWSENPNVLAAWYKDVFKLQEDLRLTDPDDTGVGFNAGDVMIWFGYHSNISGKNKDPLRHILEFRVDNLNEIHLALTKANATIIREISFAQTINADVLTAQDPEGNTIQFFQERMK